jgi:enamine deaminase RidA (YjgF/YER057c/UK114 family)
MFYIEGRNGIDSAGNVVATDLAGQARQALANLQECLAAAAAGLEHIVKWTVLIREGESISDGFGAFVEAWGARPNPPAIDHRRLSGLAVPAAVVEIEAMAAVPARA